MSFEEEFDRIIKQKADEAGFPFDEKNWEKMSRQLDAERKVAGMAPGRKLYIAAAFLLFFSATGYFVFMGIGNEGPGIADLKVPEAPGAIQVAAELMNKTEVRLKEETIVALNNKSNKTTAVKERAEAPEKSAGSNEAATNVKTENLKVSASNQVTKQTFAKQGNSQSGMKRREKAVSMDSDRTSSEENSAPAQQVIPAVVETPPVNNINAGTEGVIEETQLAKNTSDSNIPVVEHLQTPEILQPEQLMAIRSGIQSDSPEKEILSVPFSMLKYFDDDYYKKAKNKTHFLNLEAGTTYLMGWQVKNGADGKGFNWYGGLNYGLYLNRELSISAGLQFYNIGNIKQAFFSGSKTEFGFSSVTSHTVITASSLYYMAVPVKLSFALNAQNRVGVGAIAGMLVNSKNNIETYTTSENGKTNIENHKKVGAYEGISSANLMLSAFYNNRLTKRLALNGEFIYGLTDIFNNTAAVKNTETALGFRLSLQYTLFDK